MRRHMIVAQIILLILSVINFALAAPLSARGIAEDVTTASPKRWNPSNERQTSSADRTNTPTSLGSSDSDYRLEQELRPHDPRSPMDPNPPPPPNNLPSGIDLNDAPQPIQEPTDSGSHRTDPEPSPDVSPSAPSNIPESASSSQPHGSNPPPPQGIDLNDPLLSPGLTNGQPPLAPPSSPGPLKRPSSPSDPGPSKRPYILWPSTSALGPSDPGASTSALGELGPEPSTLALGESGPDPSTWALGDSGPEPSTWALGPSDPGSPTRPYRPLNPGPSWAPPPSVPGPSLSDPEPSTLARPYPDLGPSSDESDPEPSASDPGPSIHPLSNPGPPQHGPETDFSDLFRGRFKRRISGSRSVNAAQRELQGILDSREYVSASFPLPPTFQLP
ncbi:hypothetical protein V8E52_012043 [Russula decolorans]